MTALHQVFDRIFIINLPSRADRRAQMAAQLKKIGLVANAGHVEIFDASRPDSAGEFESIGARGCFMSHLRILKKSAELGYRRILIFEDDLNFSDDYLARQGEIANALSASDWGVFYGGYERYQSPDKRVGLQELESVTGLACTHFIGFNGAAIRKAADYLEVMANRKSGDPAGGPMHVDGAYFWFRRANPDLTTLIASPPLGYQRPSRTDIHQLNWYDRLPLVRELTALVRSLRHSSQ